MSRLKRGHSSPTTVASRQRNATNGRRTLSAEQRILLPIGRSLATIGRRYSPQLPRDILKTERFLSTPGPGVVAEYSHTGACSAAACGLVAGTGPASGRTAGGSAAARWCSAPLRSVWFFALRAGPGLPPPPSGGRTLPRRWVSSLRPPQGGGGRLRGALPPPPAKAAEQESRPLSAGTVGGHVAAVSGSADRPTGSRR